MDCYDAYSFLRDHPIFNDFFSYSLDLNVVKVDPNTQRIEDDEKRNTKTEVWLECGPVEFDEMGMPHPTHDIDLDCGGSTFEDAIIKLAGVVLKKYGNYKITE